MKKLMKSIQLMAALLMAVAATTACSNDDNIIEEPQPAEPQTYTLTVEATMDGDATRALSIDGTTLNATWTAGDVVTVYKQIDEYTSTNYGTLTATNVSADGHSCTLTGELTSAPAVDNELTLQFNSGGYVSQKGTLDYIATHCDIAKATVTVASVTDNVITTTGGANFVNQQAIVKFTLKESDGTALSVSQLRVKHGSTTYKVTPDAATSELYVAIPGGSGTVTMVATLDDTSARYYQKSGVSFANSQYYTVGVKMNMGNVNLAALTANYEAKAGDVLYGTLPPDLRLSVRSGAEITLNGVTTQKSSSSLYYNFPGIECLGDATINLGGSSTVIASSEKGPGIFVPKGNTLTIQGNGTLNASGLPYNAGIGGGDSRTVYKDCGSITITGGTVTATGGQDAAGIGCSYNGTCGNIKISGGNITATGGQDGAGIGSGDDGICGNIKISGGTVTATKGGTNKKLCSIGKSDGGTCGTVTIGGTVYYNGTDFLNGGKTYLTDSPFTWPTTP